MANPLEDFGELKKRLTAFTEAFESRLNSQSTQLLNQKNTFHLKLNDLKTQQARLAALVETLKAEETAVRTGYNQDLADITVSRAKLETLALNQTKLVELREKLTTQIAEINASILARSEQLQETKRFLRQQTLQNPTELYAYESILAMRIEARAVDVIRFVWWNVNPDNYNQEVSLDLDLVTGYKLVQSEPALLAAVVGTLEEDFQKHRELSVFLGGARKALATALQHPVDTA